jgi:putative flippase GtrA
MSTGPASRMMRSAQHFSRFIGRGALEQSDALPGTLRFIAMGLLATLVYFVTVLTLHRLGLGVRLASVLALGVGWIVSYLAQSRVTFAGSRSTGATCSGSG